MIIFQAYTAIGTNITPPKNAGDDGSSKQTIVVNPSTIPLYHFRNSILCFYLFIKFPTFSLVYPFFSLLSTPFGVGNSFQKFCKSLFSFHLIALIQYK